MFVGKISERLQIWLPLAALVLALNLTAAATPKSSQAGKTTTPPDAESGQYVGSSTCQGCHDEIYKGFEASAHFATTKPSKMAPGGHGCESCHGPGAAHVEGGGDKTKIFRFTTASPDVINERCLTCHQQNQERGNWSRSPHATNAVTCIGCHSPHHARESNALLIAATPALCYRCHTEQKADFAKPFRHRVNEGLIQCQDCHNPHGGYIVRRALRTTPSQEEVCYKCHRDKQGPFLYEHLPVKTEGCVSCHTPHGSVNPRLLRVQPVNVLCMQCHSPAPNSATPAIPSFHNQTQKYQACTMCHPMIHGSNAVETLEY